ncbi:metallophosphoesterase family protein [Salinicoccus sp. HZC-1]|uniref:metallophosphoesterase family protein n=1 Tax=Salinicoccus sp. HZC-1 TaxID=3385497 RepID=UPI00398AAA4D
MGVRIAVISDIHGNHYALSKVLEDIKESDVDEIYCLGDIVSLGHQTDKVMDTLNQLENMKFIQGNHDDEVVKAFKGKTSEIKGPEHEHHLYIAEHICLEYIQKLERLRLTATAEIYGHNILMTHYHLDGNGLYLPIDEKPTLASLQKHYDNSQYDVILFGHDHMTLHIEDENRLFINPGALGVTVDEFSPYTIMEFGSDGAIDLEFKKVSYDRDSFVKELRNENPPALDFILKVLLKEEG